MDQFFHVLSEGVNLAVKKVAKKHWLTLLTPQHPNS
jgi:hypothetical protein